MKKNITSQASLIAKLKPLFIAAVMTVYAILTSFLGGSPMLA